MECQPVCWTQRDGGWAAEVWEWWVSGAGTCEPMTGVFAVNWPALASIVPRAVMEDDEERLEVIRGLRIIAGTLNNPKDQLFPDQPE